MGSIGIVGASASPIQTLHNPSGQLYRAGQSCPRKDLGKETHSTGTTIIKCELMVTSGALRWVKVSTAATASSKTTTSFEFSTLTNGVAIIADTANSTGKLVTTGTLTVSVVNTLTGATLCTWATSQVASGGTRTLDWSLGLASNGDTVLTLSPTPIGGVSWSGPATADLPQAAVSGIDIGVKATFNGAKGLMASSSKLTTEGF